ncbi:hypothetical protein [Bacillus sinesaloumensis]|nr:hypothetical protein [Bacillus sinesaloumensis]
MAKLDLLGENIQPSLTGRDKNEKVAIRKRRLWACQSQWFYGQLLFL